MARACSGHPKSRKLALFQGIAFRLAESRRAGRWKPTQFPLIAAALQALSLRVRLSPCNSTRASNSFTNRTDQIDNVFLFLFLFIFFPIYYLRPSFSLSLLVVTQIRCHIAGSSPPPPHYGSCLAFFVSILFQLFLPSSTCVELWLPRVGVLSKC